MKNFSLKTRESSHRSSSKKRILAAGALTLGAIILLYLIGGLVGSLAAKLTVPLYATRQWFLESSATIPTYFRDRNELIKELRETENERDLLLGNSARVERLRAENERLRSLLGDEFSDRIGAAVVARPPYLPYDALLLDKGARHGVVERAIVYHAEDQAIGFISKVFDGSSLVTLFTTPGVRTSAFVFGPDIYTNIHGEGGGVFRVSVPQGIELREGNVVVLLSFEPAILGTIDTVTSIPTQPEQHGYATMHTPIQSLQYVSISSETYTTPSFEAVREYIANFPQELFTVEIPEDVIVTVENATSSATSSQEYDEASP